jgi:hypothetical protein
MTAPWVRDGKPAYTYNFVGLQEYTVNATEPLAPGKATIRLDFAYDGNGRGKGGKVTISVNGKQVGSGRVERTNSNIFSGDDAADAGVDEGTNVSVAYRERENKFTGKIAKVTIEQKETTPAVATEAEKARRQAAVK